MKSVAWMAISLIVWGLALGLWQLGTVAAGEKTVRQENARLGGTWEVVKAEREGKPIPQEEIPYTRVTIKGDTMMTFKGKEPGQAVGFRLDPSKKPKWIDFKSPNPKLGPDLPGIYRLEGDQLTICGVSGYRNEKPERPTDFSTKSDIFRLLIILKRVSP